MQEKGKILGIKLIFFDILRIYITFRPAKECYVTGIGDIVSQSVSHSLCLAGILFKE